MLSANAELALFSVSLSPPSPLRHDAPSRPLPDGVQTCVQVSREARRLSQRRDLPVRPPCRTPLSFRRPFHRPPGDRERGANACYRLQQPCTAGRVPHRFSPRHLPHLFWLEGRCKFETNCRHRHDRTKDDEVLANRQRQAPQPSAPMRLTDQELTAIASGGSSDAVAG